jgi:hypothetical protein
LIVVCAADITATAVAIAVAIAAIVVLLLSPPPLPLPPPAIELDGLGGDLFWGGKGMIQRNYDSV